MRNDTGKLKREGKGGKWKNRKIKKGKEMKVKRMWK